MSDPRPAPRPNRLWLVAGGVALVALLAGVLVGWQLCRGRTLAPAPAKPPPVAAAPSAPNDVKTLPADEQLRRAFQVAFDARRTAKVKIGEEDVEFTPGKLVWTDDGAILISEGRVRDFAHVSSGKLAVHYLRPEGGSFVLVKAFVPAVETGSMGAMSEWGVSSAFGDRPMIYAEGGGTWQGYTCASTELVELRAGGPARVALIPTTYDNSGSIVDDAAAVSYDGKILNIVKGRSFDVRYTGSKRFTDHYVLRGGSYVLAGGASQMERC